MGRLGKRAGGRRTRLAVLAAAVLPIALACEAAPPSAQPSSVPASSPPERIEMRAEVTSSAVVSQPNWTHYGWSRPAMEVRDALAVCDAQVLQDHLEFSWAPVTPGGRHGWWVTSGYLIYTVPNRRDCWDVAGWFSGRFALVGPTFENPTPGPLDPAPPCSSEVPPTTYANPSDVPGLCSEPSDPVPSKPSWVVITDKNVRFVK